MLALYSILHPTDYAKNYAGIMGTGLVRDHVECCCAIITAYKFKHTGNLLVFVI